MSRTNHTDADINPVATIGRHVEITLSRKVNPSCREIMNMAKSARDDMTADETSRVDRYRIVNLISDIIRIALLIAFPIITLGLVRALS